MVKHIKSEDYEEIIKNKTGSYVIDFWAAWCGPCKMLAPEFEQVSEEIKDVNFCKINVDDEGELALKLKVISIPTILFIKDGVVTDKTVGYMPKDELKEFINSNK